MITVVTIIIKRKQFRRISSSQNQNMTWKQDIKVKPCYILM